MANIESYLKQNPHARQQVLNMQNQLKESQYDNLSSKERLRMRLQNKRNERTSKVVHAIREKKETLKHDKDNEQKINNENNSST